MFLFSQDGSQIKDRDLAQLCRYFSLVKHPYQLEDISKDNYDIIYVVGWRMATQFFRFRQNNNRVIIDLIDDPSLRLFRATKAEKNVFQKIRIFKWWWDMRNEEKEWCKKFKNFVVISLNDAKPLRSLVSKINVTVISNGVDIEYFKPSGQFNNKKQVPTLLFTGVMNYSPNNDAMLYFCRCILPLVKKEFPEIKLFIVGCNPSERLQQIAKMESSIVVTGFVEDIRPYFEKATVYVCPLRWGTGIKNKILESWAMGRSIVATSVSCEGLNAIHEKNILIADDPHQFAKQVIMLLKNERLRQDFAKNGRKLVEEKYSWPSKSFELECLFERIITGTN